MLDSISGTLIDLGGGIDDIDLYQIFIHDTDAFSVTVSASLSEDNDASLFLFDAGGVLKLFDDDSGFDLLPQFNPGDLSGQPTGIYYLAFNLYVTEPNSDPLAGWNRNPSPFQTGLYTLSLTGTKFASSATVPEPSTILGLGVLGLGAFCQRKLSQGKKSKQDN
ncbi:MULTISPECIES: PEP-CTERM sorting domain-containing protein [Microcystis]|uniref:PEP-CTERM sorting domain-containing protein n=1 Tax=Microcystis TaxID=1125 RepID=UPI001F54C3F9|nr:MULTISPECIES: PEP-CTERM sorting domain-containing protein [Microcystis]UZO76334.1 PEP-CTERM sorting domain-containing protein [Microcystis aeruginosa str. Chao 1910]